MIAVETNNYRAKSTTFGIEWRSPWGTRAEVELAAAKFCADWSDIGVSVSARVFYRDGSAVSDFNIPAIQPSEAAR